MLQTRAHCGGPAFYGGDFGASSTQATPRRSVPPDFVNCDVTPPGSAMISLHQKLDQILSSNGEQKSAIEELKRESATLKEQLVSVREEIQMMETRATPVVSAKMKLPPVVSVSCCKLRRCHLAQSLVL